SKDKTLYKTGMYVKFPVCAGTDKDGGELYVGISADAVTAGFRIYGGPKRKESVLTLIAQPRIEKNPKLLATFKKKLGRKYDSYWYWMVKGAWTTNPGWPKNEDWPKLRAWVVRKKFPPAAAARTSFTNDLEQTFKGVYPLLKFTSIPE